MRKIKTVIIVVVIVALLGVSASVGLNYIKQQNQTEVLVVNVGSLASDYYAEDTSLEGMVTTSVSQSIYQDKDMIIEEVHVVPGDSVKKGELLVSFDMTLVEMELGIEKLKLQKYQQDLVKAEKRLISLQNGGPIVEDSDYGGSNILGSERDGDDLAFLENRSGQYYLATILPSMFAPVFGDGEEIAEDDFSGAESNEAANDSSDLFGSGLIDPPQPTATPSPTPTPDLGPDMDLFIDEKSDVITGISDGNEIFYEVLDEETMPICGSGTEVDPYVFLCSADAEYIIAKGSFLNKMAGYTPEGTEMIKEGGYWYQLEFHQNNIVADYNNRKTSCTGYFLIDGCMLSQPVNMDTEMEFYQEDAIQYEQEELPEEPEIPSGGIDTTPTISRADAIKSQKTIIASLQLSIAETELNIKKLEKKVNKKEIYSKIDGVVAESENSYSGDSGELFTIKSDKGFYVSGSVSELMRDQLQEGTTITCMSYEKGYFDAVVTDVSDYPTTSNSYWGNGNPNASYYTFSAEITDTEIEFTSEDWITISIPDESAGSDKLIISKAFVKSENGVSYVYKDDQGVLKKQILSVGGSVDGGYSVLINAGLTREDKIAFPYGKAVVEGAKTREGSIDELYGY